MSQEIFQAPPSSPRIYTSSIIPTDTAFSTFRPIRLRQKHNYRPCVIYVRYPCFPPSSSPDLSHWA